MKDKILEELRFSVAMVLSREEVVPRFRVILRRRRLDCLRAAAG